MKNLLIAMFVLIIVGATARAQSNTKAVELVEDLKLQLIDLSAKEEAAKLQAELLDESLKPENIERSLAGIGSTRPEDLREQRRRQLTIEKTAVEAKLEQLRLQRLRLEQSLLEAESKAYQQSAKGSPPVENYLGAGLAKPGRLLTMLMAGIVLIGVFAAGGLFIRRRLIQ